MEQKGKIEIDESKVIRRRYKIRTVGNRSRSIETTIPREAFEREARQRGMSVSDAIEKLDAVWGYNNFPGLYLSFEEKEKK